MPIWEVGLFVYGPITVKGHIALRNVAKGFRPEQQFYSDINLRGIPSGVSAIVIARADTNKLAHKAALFFLGQMLDVLAVQIKQPLYISLLERQPLWVEYHKVRRIVEREEWLSAFDDARSLAKNEPTFLRAMGWYRKGLYTEDPFDKFLAFWNSIEIVAAKYHPKTGASKGGIKNQIWECFKTLWGECDHWPLITGDEDWIKSNYELRKDIAHDIASIDVKQVEPVLEKLDIIEKVSYEFLGSWRNHQLDLQYLPTSERQLQYSD